MLLYYIIGSINDFALLDVACCGIIEETKNNLHSNNNKQ